MHYGQLAEQLGRPGAARAVGAANDLGKAICEAAALKCDWVETSFDALIPGLMSKKFDAINSAMNITEKRRESIDFTQPIYRIPSQLVGKSGSAVDATPEGLKGKTIGWLCWLAAPRVKLICVTRCWWNVSRDWTISNPCRRNIAFSSSG
jgi:hypothetical protein